MRGRRGIRGRDYIEYDGWIIRTRPEYRKCGKKNCRCQQGGELRHGPYYVGRKLVDGKQLKHYFEELTDVSNDESVKLTLELKEVRAKLESIEIENEIMTDLIKSSRLAKKDIIGDDHTALEILQMLSLGYDEATIRRKLPCSDRHYRLSVALLKVADLIGIGEMPY